MSMPPAIRVQGLWKEYVVNHAQERHGTFYDLLASGLKAPLRRLRQLGGAVPEQERFWALRDVSFDIAPGEVVGVIGRNGAGKSTLLKILSRITAPTKGRIEVRGRLASLLEVGTGFHPELSGRENIYLNGAILGMTRAEVARKFDEIVAFAEVEKFIDTPVKRYSSGMYVRLAFAVAAHLEPDILVVDEVLAVGDVQFQKKCMGKLGSVSREGRTVIFVTHNMSAMTQLCGKALLLESGTVAFNGTATLALAAYTRSLMERPLGEGGDTFGSLAGEVVFDKVVLNGKNNALEFVVSPLASIAIELHWHTSRADRPLIAIVEVKRDGLRVISQRDSTEPVSIRSTHCISRFELPAFFLSPGEYFLEFGIFTPDDGGWVWTKNQIGFQVLEEWHPAYQPAGNMGLVNLTARGQRMASSVSDGD